jgi:hypothetical protein
VLQVALVATFGVVVWAVLRRFSEGDVPSNVSSDGGLVRESAGASATADGFCLVVIRETGRPVLRRWRYGAFYSDSGQVWWESRWRMGSVGLNGFRIIGRRVPTTIEAVRWGSGRVVLRFEFDDREFECAVPEADESFVRAALRA